MCWFANGVPSGLWHISFGNSPDFGKSGRLFNTGNGLPARSWTDGFKIRNGATMAEKMIGSLIYGEHTVPKKQRPWQQRLRIPVAIGVGVILILFGAWKYVNYREEKSVSGFL